MRLFAEWADSHGIKRLDRVSTPHLQLYASHLLTIGNSVNARNTKLGVVKRFYDYLVQTRVIARSPVPSGWVPRAEISPGLPTLSMNEVDALYEASRSGLHFLETGLVIALCGFDSVKLKHVALLRADQVRVGAEGLATIPVERNDGTIHNRRLSTRSSEHLRLVLESRPNGLLFSPVEARTEMMMTSVRRSLTAAGKVAQIEGAVTARRLEVSYRRRDAEDGGSVESLIARLGLDGTSVNKFRAQILPKHGPNTEGARLRETVVHELGPGDLLSQAQRLCSERGVTPIAPIVIAGAALEMVLRRMCERIDGIEVHGNQPGIDAYASALRRSRVISKHSLALLQAHAKLRNEAAHGTGSADVNVPNAELMIRGIALFLDGADDGLTVAELKAESEARE